MHKVVGVVVVASGAVLASPSLYQWLLATGRGSAPVVILGLLGVVAGLVLMFSKKEHS